VWAALGLVLAAAWAWLLGCFRLRGKFLFFSFTILILYFVFPVFEFYLKCYFVLQILACLTSTRVYLVIMYILVVLIKYFV
jgi:hypothetical protein